MKTDITQEYLRAIFYLDEDGDLFWRDTGECAESFRHKYKAVWLDGIRHYSHRLIWMYLYGYWPHQVEHKNGDGSYNKPSNLRESTQSQNNANANHGKFRGVEAHGTKYRARIWVEGKRIELGSFQTMKEAIDAYNEGALEYFGEFAFCARSK